MKTRLFGFLIVTALFNICCESKTFDVASVSPGEDAKKYNFESTGLFLKDETPEKNIVQYYADENKDLTYDKIPLEKTMGTRITVYKGKIGAVDTNADEKYALEFVEKIVGKNGKPTATVKDQATVEAKSVQPIFEKLKKISPENVSWNQGEKNSFTYPTSFFWDDGKNYSILSIAIEEGGRIRNKYVTVTKEAYRNNAVFGLQYPTPQGSPWYNYMK
ncbi:hypothetical protein ACM46_05940 [Chryseobacterium angstadtii]|uniref:Uncharacterized protein n=1 Tax=Chryseobacterium angstadtii TaxID=558151 RepID=A0A0J7IHG7_9FLAO|nr:hypothetical protein [Chryseobacterium angstadtii]KMQ65436.1 hypothetical protein ACM46_05940 [Chryseobacterium angstadtii]